MITDSLNLSEQTTLRGPVVDSGIAGAEVATHLAHYRFDVALLESSTCYTPSHQHPGWYVYR